MRKYNWVKNNIFSFTFISSVSFPILFILNVNHSIRIFLTFVLKQKQNQGEIFSWLPVKHCKRSEISCEIYRLYLSYLWNLIVGICHFFSCHYWARRQGVNWNMHNVILFTIFNKRKLVLELINVVKVKVTMKKFRNRFLLLDLLDDLWYC